jgi:hypothetical protein
MYQNVVLGAKVVVENMQLNFSRNVGETELYLLHHLLKLLPLRIEQIGWFNCHVSKCLSMDDCTTEAYSTPTWPGTQKLGIGPTLLLS